MCIVVASFDFEDSVCGVITVPVVKKTSLADSGAPRLRVTEVGFWCFSSAVVAL